MSAIVMSTTIVIQSVLCQVVKCYKNLTSPNHQHHIIIPLEREAKCLAVFETIHKSGNMDDMVHIQDVAPFEWNKTAKLILAVFWNFTAPYRKSLWETVQMEMTDLRPSHLWPGGKRSLLAFSFVPRGMMVFLSSKVTFIINTATKSSHPNRTSGFSFVHRMNL